MPGKHERQSVSPSAVEEDVGCLETRADVRMNLTPHAAVSQGMRVYPQKPPRFTSKSCNVHEKRLPTTTVRKPEQ